MTILGLKMIIFGHFSRFLASFKISFSSLQHPTYKSDFWLHGRLYKPFIQISSQDRENQLFNLLSALTDSVDRSESRRVSRRASIITPTGPLIPNGTPIVYRDELTDQIKNGPPHSAPPESPIRAILVNPDRRRTSSDTSVGRSKLPPHQQCSNVKCERIAQWRCIGCEKAIYCGKECQETHWTNGHEDECDGEDRDKWPWSPLTITHTMWPRWPWYTSDSVYPFCK